MHEFTNLLVPEEHQKTPSFFSSVRLAELPKKSKREGIRDESKRATHDRLRRVYLPVHELLELEHPLLTRLQGQDGGQTTTSSFCRIQKLHPSISKLPCVLIDLIDHASWINSNKYEIESNQPTNRPPVPSRPPAKLPRPPARGAAGAGPSCRSGPRR